MGPVGDFLDPLNKMITKLCNTTKLNRTREYRTVGKS